MITPGTPHRATLADVRAHQSTDDDNEEKESLEETGHDKKDFDHQNDSQSDG